MKSLGRMFAAAKPEAVVIATPHNVHISGALGVVVSSRVAGQLDGAPSSVALDCPTDADLAWRVLASYVEAEIPSVGISFGSNYPSSEVAPDLVERAKADSWWQMLILAGATGDGWRGRLISYEAPTYFGMLTAGYTPRAKKPAAGRPLKK